MNPEDYECEVTAPRIPARVGRDVQPTGWVGTLALLGIGAMLGRIFVLAATL